MPSPDRPSGDLDAYGVLADHPKLPECQHLHFLQMAREKLCKAHLYNIGSAQPGALDSSHAYVEKQLPVILRIQYDREHRKKRGRDASGPRGSVRWRGRSNCSPRPSMTVAAGRTTANTPGKPGARWLCRRSTVSMGYRC
ncbi:MAG: hypothetical protein M5U26_15195 [Planctomycetota bacterium]|nr:hypothetical protein [Planctomycetota bacterium]